MCSEERQSDSEVEELRAELAKAKFLFDTLAEFTADWEFWLDPSWRFVYVSPACANISGYEKDCFIEDAALFNRIVHEEDRDLVNSLFLSAMERSRVSGIDFRIIDREKDVRWLSMSLFPIEDNEGDLLGIRGSLRDVTERRKTENERMKWTENLQRLFCLAEDILIEESPIRLLGRVTDVAYALTGGRKACAFWRRRNGDSAFKVIPCDQSQICPMEITEQFENELFDICRLLDGKYLGGEWTESHWDENVKRMLLLKNWLGESSGFVAHGLTGKDERPAGFLAIEGHDLFGNGDKAILVQLATLASLGMVNLDADAVTKQHSQELAAVFEGAAFPLVQISTNKTIVRANKAARSLPFHLEKSIEKELKNDLQRALAGQEVAEKLFQIGKSHFLESIVPISTNSHIDSALLSLVDVSERERLLLKVEEQKTDLEAALDEQQTLLLEIHHRVKNNLQLIASMLSLQAHSLNDPKTRHILEESRSRVLALAFVHELLYQNSSLRHLEVSSYIEKLVHYHLKAQQGDHGPVDVAINIDDVQLQMNNAISIGLITNELVSNALEHAFVDQPSGSLHVSLVPKSSNLILTVADDGVGLPPNFESARSSSLGLELVQTLAKQLGGTFRYNSGKGATFQIEFPAMEIGY